MSRLFLLAFLVVELRAATVRIKDVAAIEGVRENQLLGYGLVVGLNGTGDKKQAIFSAQSLANMLDRMGVQVEPRAMQVRNTAAVMVTANLPPFAQPGSRIDVTVAAIGDATNLQGGLLLLTALRAADGSVFAAAQGSVVTGGFSAGRGAGNSMTVNHPTSGRIPGGALVERAAPSVSPTQEVRLQLRQADYTTAARLTAAVNKQFGAALAVAESAAVVTVTIPQSLRQNPVQFVADLEAVPVDADRTSRIVINERTGTIVLGKDVKIRPVAILHGALTVEIQTAFNVSQPAPLSSGTTAVTPDVSVGVKEEKARSVMLRENATVEDLVRGLMAIGSTPRDVIAVLQNVKAAGALDAEIEVI